MSSAPTLLEFFEKRKFGTQYEYLIDPFSGVPFLANPDLVARWKSGAALNAPDFGTFYTPGAKGYTDYPFLG